MELTSTHDVIIKDRNILTLIECGSRNSVITIQTRHGLKIVGFESAGLKFPGKFHIGPRAHPASCKRVQFLFAGDRPAGVWS